MSLPSLSARGQRVLVVRALVRAVATAALLVFLYYELPMDRPVNGDTIPLLLICLAVLAAVIAWQVRSIVRSDSPALRAIEALAATTPMYLLLFASAYFLMERDAGASFTEPLTRTDALYFSVTVLSSVGFGDIAPKSQTARLVVTLQMFLDLILLGLAVKVFLGAVRVGRERHSTQQPE